MMVFCNNLKFIKKNEDSKVIRHVNVSERKKNKVSIENDWKNL